jgi:hypothetical protein
MLTKLRDERGSLPLAMLAVLVVGSLVSVLVATVITGQRNTRFDQSFEQAIQVAEVGLDRMTFLVQRGFFDDLAGEPSFDGATADGEEYEVTATRNGDDWHVVSTGSAADGTSRTVEVWVRIYPPFRYGSFGRGFFLSRGVAMSDSFEGLETESSRHICKSGGGYADPTKGSDTNVVMCNPKGESIIATTGELSLLGTTINEVDRVEIHHSKEVEDPRSDATGSCEGVPQACASDKLHHFREPLEFPLIDVPRGPDGATLTPSGAFPDDDPTPTPRVTEDSPDGYTPARGGRPPRRARGRARARPRGAGAGPAPPAGRGPRRPRRWTS